MKILKFGGSSLRDSDRIGVAVDIVARAAGSGEPVAVVVSALGGVTDQLGGLARAIADGSTVEGALDGLRRRHHQVIETLARTEELEELAVVVDETFSELDRLLQGIALVRECSPRTLDQVYAFGERLSALVVAAAARRAGLDAVPCDARDLIVTDTAFGSAEVLAEPSYERIRRRLQGSDPVQIVTGFIGRSAEGETTTLGRGGSDLTAALLGAAVEASAVELWTDVDGVMSADPRLVPDAFSLERLSYEELMEMSHFGAKVVYPPSVLPARRGSIPLWIKNTLNPAFPGTLIEADRTAPPPGSRLLSSPVTGITSISEVALVRLEGDGMAGLPGTARRLFDALAREGISVILISQASSEHSICFAVEPAAAERARRAVDAEFAHDRQVGAINDLVIEDHQSVVAVVGEGMRERPGISGRVFGVLGRQGINVRAIAQGSSELNISLVVDRNDECRTLRAIHDSFFRSEEQTLQLFVAGIGRVGATLLEQVEERRGTMSLELGLDVHLAAVADSRHMLLDRRGLRSTPQSWKERLAKEGESADLEGLVEYILETSGLRVFVDCTASDRTGDEYSRLLASGVAVVTANKKPFSGPLELFARARDARPLFARGLYHEATVGAGLPVLRTLRSLLDTGDRLQRIEGVFSGTLAYLLDEMQSGSRFSAALKKAHELGYTEPDPRDDLSGMDVARKLLILAREAGLSLELDDLEVEPFVSLPPAAELDLDELWGALEEADERLAKRQEEAQKAGKTLCYLARLDGERATVSLQAVGGEHPCATLSGTDNLFAFSTERYSPTPLVIRGPGAGPAVTAGCLFADLLRAHAELAALPSSPGGAVHRTWYGSQEGTP